MTHMDTQETLAANRKYIQGAMKVPLLSPEKSLIWQRVGVNKAMKPRFMNSQQRICDW